MKKIPIILLAIVLFASCAKKNQYQERVLFLMGTVVNITIPVSEISAVGELSAYMNTLADIVKSDSIRISENTGPVEINSLTYDLLNESEKYTDISGGRFNPAIFTLIKLYGFPEGPYNMPEDTEINSAMALVSSVKIETWQDSGKFYADGKGLSVDLGAYAKGRIVDMASEFLTGKGINNHIISAGGDLFASGMKYESDKWRLGIIDPDNRDPFASIVNLSGKGLATSGSYERFFINDEGERISHIFDAVTGENAQYYKSLSVIADSAELADAFATLYYLSPTEDILKLCTEYETPVFIVDQSNSKLRLCGWENYE